MYPTRRSDFEFELNPYDSFMRNHLKHYGYYTGKNESFRTTGVSLGEWERRRSSFSLSDHVSDTEYENQALKEEKLDADNRFTEGQKRTTQLVFSYSAGKVVPKLKEPRNLYALSKEPGPQQAPRWPADIEVLPDPVIHKPYVPDKQEPFYQPTGFEKMPMTLPEGEGRTVYYSPASKDEYFLRSRVGGSRKGCLPRAWKPKSPQDTILVFESRFESGNLMRAVLRSEFDYDLYLRYDLYTTKHTQWFYFRVQNVRKNIKYRFTIVNFMKPGSLYNCGMKPLFYSEQDANTKNIGWRRVGEDIKYYKNDLRRTDAKADRNFYSLTWTCSFPHDNDTCYFAHCYPYTYSDLQQYLLNLSNDPIRSQYCKQRVLCRSLAGNLVYILTITAPAKHLEDAKGKKAVVLTARVHPGETNSSWMMKGFLDYLTSDLADAKLLRDMFVFKIVPMLNPDGVIVGNYRCSLAGRDLNRNYKSVLKDSFPSVSNTKTMIKKLKEERDVVVYCDLHGHSRKQNVFIYGCDNKKSPKYRLTERLFPIILGKNAHDKFSYSNSKFKVQKSKEGTGRVVIWQMGVTNSYTMEASFCGSTLGDQKFYHFRTVDFEAMGCHFCDSLLDYCDPDETKCNEIMKNLEDKLRKDIMAHLERTGTSIPEDGVIDLTADYTSAIESSTTGSDSSVDDGLPVHLLALAPKLTKKKKLKSRKERDKKRNSIDIGKEKGKEERTFSASKGRRDSNKCNEGDKKPPTPKVTDKEDKDSKMKHKHYDRSTVHSAGRARHIHSRTGDGIPTFTHNRCEAKTKKKSEYLEALTNAFLMSGVLKPSTQEVESFRYSASGFGMSSSGLPLAHVEGLCPHHEKAFAEQFVASQLAGLTFAEEKYNWSHSREEVSNSSLIDQRSITPSRPFSPSPLVALSSSPTYHNPLPLDEYIRSTSRQGQTFIPGSTRTQKSSVNNSSSRARFEDSEQALPSPRPRSYADFIRRDISDQSLVVKPKCSSATAYIIHDRPKSSKSLHLLKANGHLQVYQSPEQPLSTTRYSQDAQVLTPVYSERPKSRHRDGQGTIAEMTRNKTDGAPEKHVNSWPGDSNRGFISLTSEKQLSPSPPQHSQSSPRRHLSSSMSHRSSKSDKKGPLTESGVKSHRFTTEATPITDPETFTKQKAQSPRRFSKAKDFYSNVNSLQNSRQADTEKNLIGKRGDMFAMKNKIMNQSSSRFDIQNDSPASHDGKLDLKLNEFQVNNNNFDIAHKFRDMEASEAQKDVNTNDSKFVYATTEVLKFSNGKIASSQQTNMSPRDRPGKTKTSPRLLTGTKEAETFVKSSLDKLIVGNKGSPMRKKGIVPFEEYQNLQRESRMRRVQNEGKIMSEVQINIPDTLDVLTSSRRNQSLAKSPADSQSNFLRRKRNTNLSNLNSSFQSQENRGEKDEDMGSAMSPHTTENYIQVSKLALQLRNQGLEEQVRLLMQQNSGLVRSLSIPDQLVGAYRGHDLLNDGEGTYHIIRGPPLTKHSLPQTPADVPSKPVSARKASELAQDGTKIVNHQGGFQGISSNPSFFRKTSVKR